MKRKPNAHLVPPFKAIPAPPPSRADYHIVDANGIAVSFVIGSPETAQKVADSWNQKDAS